MKVSAILDQIDLGGIALPNFQRGYVWNRDQVRSLMRSLYRKYPIGSLLVWVTNSEGEKVGGQGEFSPGPIRLLVDGQQRITSLYGIIRGKPPPSFKGDPRVFTGLYFHLGKEIFEFYAPMKMKDDPLWINVTELMQIKVGEFIKRLVAMPELQEDLNTYINRLNAIENIKEIDLHLEEVTGEDKTVDVVVDIFNTVNSGGTKLSKADLSLAKICADWPEARREMEARLNKWERAGFYFRIEWLLRNINTMLTGKAFFSALENVDSSKFKEGLDKAEKTIDRLIDMISARLGLDHNRVLGSQYSFPLMVRYLEKRGGYIADPKERDKLLYWYVQTLLWGRYAGSTETTLSRDLNIVESEEDPLNSLINELRQNRGDLHLYPADFTGWSQGARFYPMMYMLTWAWHAQDWDSGLELTNHLLGKMSHLELHHIFPKVQLYRHGYTIAEANAIANFTFLTKETNLKVSNQLPEDYLEEFVQKDPGVIQSHSIPMNRKLWKIENYRHFLDERRKLLAQAANDFLDSLLAGNVPEIHLMKVPGGVATTEEEQKIKQCNEWVTQQGLPAGQYLYELANPETGEVLAILDLAWPNGLQQGYSQPVALLIDESSDTLEAANRAGYRYFTDVYDFYDYVQREVLAEVE